MFMKCQECKNGIRIVFPPFRTIARLFGTGGARFVVVKNTFLIRTPEKSIPSYYRLDQELTSEEIGLETQYRHFELVRGVTGEVPVVIEADDLIKDTEATMRAYWWFPSCCPMRIMSTCGSPRPSVSLRTW